MTTIVANLTIPTSSGDNAGVKGELICTPTRRRDLPSESILPASFPVPVDAGNATFGLAPTDVDWCWCIEERVPRGRTRWVTVPDSAEPIAYGDLVDVDPSTLSPTAEPEAAWWAVAGGLQVAHDEAVEAADDAALSRTAAGLSATDAAASASAAGSSATASQAARVAAETARTDAQSARTDAQTAKVGAETAQTGAQTARTAAEAARDAALAATLLSPVGLFSTDNLDARVTPGLFAAGNTSVPNVARNWPITGAGLALLWVSRRGTEFVQQRVEYTTGVRAGRGFWTRTATTADAGVTWTWTAWVFNSSQRIDKTAGLALYAWDETATREQLIYGDTGWRSIPGLLSNGWTANTNVWIRRVGYLVSIVFDGLNAALRTTDAILTPPAGFVPQASVGARAAALHSSAAPAAVYRTAYTSGAIALVGSTTGIPVLYGRLDYNTSDAWPTSLPGAALGTIPNV